MDVNTQLQQTAVTGVSAGTDTTIPPVTPQAAEGAQVPEGGEGDAPENGQSEKIQWITLLILGLSVVSLVMNIISNKKQIERLSEDDKSSTKKLKELEANLRKQMGNKYESLD
jgi:hypothetical protein